MTSLNETSALPNPLTPLAFLPPEAAYQSTITNYCTAGALAVFIWDLLDNAKGDYRSLFKGRIHFDIPILAYILSRTATFGIILGSAIFSSAPTGNCTKLNIIFHSFCPISISCSTLLFFLRLRAIYNRNQIVVASFFAMWIGVIVAAVFIPLGISGGAVGPTRYCQYTSFASSSSAGLIAPLVYDTLVFTAISWQLVRVAAAEMGCRDTLHLLCSGRGLPAFTVHILVDGQLYYLITMIAGVATVVLLYAPTVPLALRAMGINPYLAIVNIMACRVFTRTRAGLIRESQISTSAVGEGKVSALAQHRLFISVGRDTQTSHDDTSSGGSQIRPTGSMNESKGAIC